MSLINTIYQCPLCQLPLHADGYSLRCQNNHNFDYAKEGYINLMPVQHKNSKNPGDSAAMMQARRQFLSTGHYQPLREKMIDMVKSYNFTQDAKLLDIGCGEGYYTDAFQQGLGCQVYGIDIAKVAICYAARRYKAIHFAVASSYKLPFLDQQLTMAVRIYAPCDYDELNRVISTDGYLLTVTPGARHLQQLKGLIYSTVKLHPLQPEMINHFRLIDEQNLFYTLNLTGEHAFLLLQMTPFYWRASQAVQQQLRSHSDFICDADFTIRIYRKEVLC